MTTIFKASEEGNLTLINSLLDGGVSVNAGDLNVVRVSE